MPKRYRHVMAKDRGDKQPSCIVGVSCESHLEPVEGQPDLERIILDRWHACKANQYPNGRWIQRDTTGTTVSDFWRWLEAYATVSGQVLVVSLEALDQWAMLEFWEGLERGQIRCGPGGREVAEQGERDKRANGAGFLVTEDPPTIAYFWLRQCPSLIRWNDIRNYGVRADHLPEQGMAQAREILRFMCDMIGCLASRSLGAVKDTAASQALFTFRHSCMTNSILCHTVKPVLDLEAAAYFSGRCECGRIGYVEGPIHELDIRGSYHYAMLRCPVPVRLRGYVLSPDAAETPDPGTALGWIAEVSLATPQPDYPYRHDAGTVFPTGLIRTTLCGPELYHAWGLGRIVAWHKWAEYDCEPALSRYAGIVYDLRCTAEAAGDSAMAAWCKSLAVSLVGKLGQRGRHWEWVAGVRPDNWYDQYHLKDRDNVVRRYQEIAGRHRREHLAEWGAESVPAIAGWITSTARMRLRSAIESAGQGRVVYMDTDSLFVTADGLARLVAAGWLRPGELGYFQHKGEHSWMEVRGIKSYRTPTSEKQTGIPPHGGSERISSNCYRISLYLSTYLSRGQRPSADRVTRQADFTQPYRHGNIGADGRVTPLVVDDS